MIMQTEQLTDEEKSNLIWMEKVNREDKIGLFGPSVCKLGLIPSCEKLLKLDLAEFRNTTGRKNDLKRGYYITYKGIKFRKYVLNETS
jgi:hypothetical protein